MIFGQADSLTNKKFRIKSTLNDATFKHIKNRKWYKLLELNFQKFKIW